MASTTLGSTLPPELAAGVEALLHEAESSTVSTDSIDSAVRELSALFDFFRPPLPAVLAAVGVVERRLPLYSAPVLKQVEWLDMLRCLPHLTEDASSSGAHHAAERHINDVRPFLSMRRDVGPLGCALACTLLPQWAACLDAKGAHWLQQCRIICTNLRTVQQQAPPAEEGREASVLALKVAALNAQAAIVLHWARSVGAVNHTDEAVPAFVAAVTEGLLSELSELAREPAPALAVAGLRRDGVLGLAAAVGLGQLVQQLAGRSAVQGAVAAKMVGVVAECARASVALDGAEASAAADGTATCLLGLRGEPWLALLRSRSKESLALVDALVPLVAPAAQSTLEVRVVAALLLSQFLSQRGVEGDRLVKDALASVEVAAGEHANMGDLVKAVEGFRREVLAA